MKKNSKKLIKRAFALMLALVMAVPTVDYSALLTVQAEETENTGITLRTRDDGKAAAAGYEEGAYVEWLPVAGANGYEVYVSQDNDNWPEKPIDDELIRSYGDYWRADALGLTQGTWYVKVDAAVFDANKNKIATVAEKTFTVEVTAHDRSGYAWHDGGTASGAYNEDGTLRSDTNVVYITNANKDDVGLQNIIYGYKQGTATVPLDVRLIGNIEDFKVMEDGDIVIETYGNIGSKGITIEGVGEDAVANGWGIRLKNAVNVEIRNLGFMNCDSKEGDNVSLQQDDKHIWVHNCDFFYGNAGTDEDQKKGDGMLDCKKSDLITFSYNHFWDSGKSCLLGLEEGLKDPNFEGRITYHHNWFDHSDSRHPRIRYFTTHIYNNYYDGNAKYGIGAAEGGASVFAESNYFRNCKYPMLISQQGSDLKSGGTFEAVKDAVAVTGKYENGSMIKAYGNKLVGISESTFIPYAAATGSSTQENSDQSEDNGFVAYVAIDDVNEEADQNNALNDGESVDADVESDDDDTKSDTDNASDDNINIDTDNVSGDDNADANMDEEYDNVNADIDTDEESGNVNADIDTDVESGDDNADADADADTDEEASLDEAEVSYAQERAFTSDASVDFDAYVVDNRTDIVPESVKTKKGQNTYNNFDTAADFYEYTPDDANDVPDIVMDGAGRVNGGDFKFEFNDNDDASYAVNDELKAKCTGYTSSLKSVGGINGSTTTVYYAVTFDPGNGDAVTVVPVEKDTAVEEPAIPENVPEGKVAFDGWYKGTRKWNFETVVNENITLVGKWLEEGEEPGDYGEKPIGTKVVEHDFTKEGMDSPYFTITGSLHTKSGEGLYNGKTYTSGNGKGKLDLSDTSTLITFKTTVKSKIVLVMLNRTDHEGKKVLIDESPYNQKNGLIETTLEVGDHSIKRKDSPFIFAIWVIPILTVNFETQGGTAVNPQTLDSGTKLTRPANDPTKGGHTFGGWYTDNTYTTEYNFDDPVTSNITLYAKFTPEGSYTVSFDTQGGSKIEAQFVKSGNKAVKPDNPTKKGYGFVGWYKNSACTEGSEYDFTTSVTGDIKLYAKWKKQYVVTFNSDEGSAVDSQTVIEGQTCRKPANPTKKGFAFEGWYTDSECADGSEYNFDTSVTSNITLYAKWIEAKGLQIDFANKEEVYTYTGNAITPEIIVSNNGNALVEGIDYTVKYSNNKKASNAAKIVVTGKGVYAGKTIPKTFTIAKKNINDNNIKAGRIVVVKSRKVPTPVLYYGGTKLTAKDFEFIDKNKTFSTKSDNETVKIRGINNFEGVRDIKVVVVENSSELKKAAQKFTVKFNSDALKKLTYTGSSLEEDIKNCITGVSDKTTNNNLGAAKYEIAFPKNVTNAGKVKFTIVGMEEYSGCNVVKTCTIQPRTINGTKNAGETPSDSDVVITGITSSLDYISTGATFKNLSITWTNKARNDEGLEPLPLIEGRDYKLSYSANKKVGTDSAKCTIVFKGNYKGKPVVKFSVAKTELNAGTIDHTANEKMVLIADKVCNGNKGVYKSTPYISINNVLVKASEYDVKYYTDAAMNNEMTKNKPLELGSNPYATVYVKITAKASSKNFKTTNGTTPITGSYKVWKKEKKSNKVDLSKAKVVFYNGSNKTTKLPYTGVSVVPDKIEVLVGGKKVDETCYSYDIIANINKGKATVVVYAKDNTNCIGGKTVTYNIAAHSFNNFNW
ncbi:MAG: InlB B-repeat-containing protein [Lachnospiraceae bacterium]|nr:InlB B-repeat-containing protein [Lachnospiraceae bacterium]